MQLTTSENQQFDETLEQICVQLQLSRSQFEDARAKYEAVGAWLDAQGSQVRLFRPTIYTQGSVRIDTTVKPIGQDEFDVDLVCEMRIDAEHDPAHVYELIWQRLHENERYRPILERKNRCLRLNYAGDFHMDILPAIPDTHAKRNKPLSLRAVVSWASGLGFTHWEATRLPQA